MSEPLNQTPMSQAIEQPEVPSEPDGKGKWRLDRLFKRNIVFVVGFVLVMAAFVGIIVVRTNNAMKSSAEKNMPSTVVGIGASEKGRPIDAMTPAEIDRLNRVGQQQSDQAKASGNMFIPKDMPLNSDVRMPAANDKGGPGGNYDIHAGRVAGQSGNANAVNAADSRRDQLINQGLETQLNRIMAQFDAPGTMQASAYEERQAKSATLSAASAPAPTSSAAAAAAAPGEVLLPGLGIFGAELTSPLDTAKSDYISARITSGPATGALVFGSGQVVGTEGVRLTFSMMSFDGKPYPIKAIALDTQTSSNAMSANIDRQIFARYVIPIFGAIGQAYASAMANPGQQVVNGVAGSTVVAPAATAQQAMYAGVASGLGKMTEAATYTGPNTAAMPVNMAIGLLFTEPVKKVTQ